MPKPATKTAKSPAVDASKGKHDYEKRNLVTSKKGTDLWACKHCGKEYVRHGVAWHAPEFGCAKDPALTAPADGQRRAAVTSAAKPEPKAKAMAKGKPQILNLVVPLDRIVAKSVLQSRQAESSELITRYTEIYRESKEAGTEPPFPALVVFSTDPKNLSVPLLLADGFHRFKSCRKAGGIEHKVEIHHGDERAAYLFSRGANGNHGLPLTLDERRFNATDLLKDEEWRQWSDREISTHVHLSPNTIAKIRKQVGAVVDKVKGKDGVVRKKAAKKAKVTESKPAPNNVGLPIHNTYRAHIEGLEGWDNIPLSDTPRDKCMPPGVYLTDEQFMLISSEVLPLEMAIGATIRSNYSEKPGKITSLAAYTNHGCVHYSLTFVNETYTKRNPGIINEIVYFRGELRHLFAINNDRLALGTERPAPAQNDADELFKIAVPLNPAPTVDEAIAKIDQALAAPTTPELPPGVYLDGDITRISSEPLPFDLVPECEIRCSTTALGNLVSSDRRVDGKGFVYYLLGVRAKGDKGNDPQEAPTYIDVVHFRGELRHTFANNGFRLLVGTKKPKPGKDDSAALRLEAKPLTEQQPPAPLASSADDDTPDSPNSLRACALDDAPRLQAAKVHGPSELIARLVAALYHCDSRKQPRTTAEVANVSGFPLSLVEKTIGTYPAGIENPGTGWMLTAEADAAVDAVLGDQATDTAAAGAEPEEVTLGDVAAPTAPARPSRPVIPLAERRASWIRNHLAEQLDKAPQLRCSEAETCGLILLVGIDTREDETWGEELVQRSIGLFAERIAHGVADRLRRGETRHLPDWRVLAQFFGIDAESISILATRSIPE